MLKSLTIEQGFQKFLANLNPTNKQRQRIQATRNTIDSALSNDDRIHLNTQKQISFLTGSYSRNTIIRPIDDVDLYVRIHFGKHDYGKSPLPILRLIASAIRRRYPNNTKINVDAPCVVVRFFGYKFEIVPAVGSSDNPDLYYVPAPGSKEWMRCYPNVPDKWLSSCNHANDRMFIPLIKMLKQWNRNNKVGLKSFHLELLTEKLFGAIAKIGSYPQGIFDWMFYVKNWIWHNNQPFIPEPGKSYEYVDEYMYEKQLRLRIIRKKMDIGLKRAERARNLYTKGKDVAAKRIWNQMFGPMFPVPHPPPAKPVHVPPKQTPAVLFKNALSMQQPTGFFGGYQRNALLDALSSPLPKPNNTLVTDIGKNALLDILIKSNDPFKK
jgi:hypothetical protein